jgi:hypothetical protein
MILFYISSYLKVFTFCIFLIVLGCAHGNKSIVKHANKPIVKHANYLSDEFDSLSVDKIDILSFVDGRQNRELELTDKSDIWVQKTFSDRIIKHLKKKGYEAKYIEDAFNDDFFDQEKIDQLTLSPPWIKELGPPETQVIMIVVVEVLERKRIRLNSVARAKVTGYLFDKRKCQLLWEDHSDGTWAFPWYNSHLIDDYAFNNVLSKIISSLPSKN